MKAINLLNRFTDLRGRHALGVQRYDLLLDTRIVFLMLLYGLWFPVKLSGSTHCYGEKKKLRSGERFTAYEDIQFCYRSEVLLR